MIYFFLFGLVLICFLATGEISLRSFSRHKLEDYCRRHKTQPRLAGILKHYEDAAIAAGMSRLLCSTLLLVAFLHYMLNRDGSLITRDWLVATAVVSALYLMVEFWIAKAVAKLWGTWIVYLAWPIWSILTVVMYPFNVANQFFNLVFHRLAGQSEETDNEEAFEDEIRTIVTEGHREGLLEEDARGMIEGVMELRDFIVSEIMTPRTDMVSIPNSLSWEEMLREIISTPHSRIPVYKENRDDIIGVLHAKDLLKEIVANELSKRCPWTSLIKEPLFVPETKPVDTLLREFQNTKSVNVPSEPGVSLAEKDKAVRAKGHLAIVLDEYGGVSGIVTLEDILEEIVGEILDEHDPLVQNEDIRELGPDIFESLGKVRIDELNEKLDLDLPDEEDYDTIAGFIFSTLGHVPTVGEQVDYEHEGKCIRFIVVAATRRRIERVRIERKQ